MASGLAIVIDLGKRRLLGVRVDAIDYAAAVEKIISASKEGRPFAATALAVHGVMTGYDDPAHAARLNTFDMVTPDGQPVRWALRWLYNIRLPDRVYGPRLMKEVLARCDYDRIPVYIYGSTSTTIIRLVEELRREFPALQIAGSEPSQFREVDSSEVESLSVRISESGARVLLVGLGCPRQELFADAMREWLDMPIIAVGAAFDYHARLLAVPPAWMQERGLEWLWRLGMEPRRLWRRYLVGNTRFAVALLGELLREPLTHSAPPAEPAELTPI